LIINHLVKTTKIVDKLFGSSKFFSYVCTVINDKNMETKQISEIEKQALYASIQKGYDELMERNRQTIEWMKSVGLIK